VADRLRTSPLFDEVIVPNSKHYRLLVIQSTETFQENALARARQNGAYTIDVDVGIDYLRGRLRTLVSDGYTFENVIFHTHGNSGMIFFGDEVLRWWDWYSPDWFDVGFNKLFPGPNTKIYFTGCDVADRTEGWKFLEASVRSLCRYGDGRAIGWTSLGFVNPFGGHVKHLWGSIRQVMLVGGNTLYYFEGSDRVGDGLTRPT